MQHIRGTPLRLPQPRFWLSRGNFVLLLCLIAFYVFCWQFSDIDLARLVNGLPKLAGWIATGWPPDFSGFPLLLQRAAETLAMATLGTTLGMLIAGALCVFAAANMTPERWLYFPARGLLNFFRGIDSFIFALIFVAAVGLGPFAGIIGIGLHTAGIIAKLWSESIETTAPGPLEAASMTAASRTKLFSMAVLPDLSPSLSSIALYAWEANVRSSTVLGLVGAGGLGQELKNSIDLLDFKRAIAIITIILVMVTVIDQVSAHIRKRLL